jgi:hypothetical protein
MSRLASHKLSIVAPLSAHQQAVGAPGWEEMQIVHADGLAVRVRQTARETSNGVRYMAEMSAGTERAAIDALSIEDLRRMIAPAVRAFSMAVALRQKRTAA